MFSMLWYARRRLRSCCMSAYSTPSTAESPPTATTNTPHESLGTPRPNAQTRTIP